MDTHTHLYLHDAALRRHLLLVTRSPRPLDRRRSRLRSLVRRAGA
jgi:hypothetical protein